MTTPFDVRSDSGVEPVRPAERIPLIDILRGFALLGILLVNFEGGVGSTLPSLDRAVQTGLDLLVSESFYPLFSFLFGLGFALQLGRARNAGVVHVYLRRLIGLFLIGTVHALLIWSGDILVNYALLGLLLIPLYRLPSRGVLLVGLLLLAFHLEGTRMRQVVRSWSSTPERVHSRELAQGLRDEARQIEGNLEVRTDQSGSWRAHLAIRWTTYGREVGGSVRLFDALRSDILLLFVIGLYVGRRRLLEDVRARRRGFALAAALGALAAVGIPLLLTLFPDAPDEVWWLRDMAANWGVTAFYIGAIALLVTAGGRAARKLSMLAPVGRMALTNYLLQSVVMTLLFFPYALGLPDLGATARLLVDVGVFFLVQVPLSQWWLARFQCGPVEWVWRSLTYGRPQPLRLKGPAGAVTMANA